jgi:regulator of replication initiation timing
LIAQEAVKILPHIVAESETPIALVPWLLASVQELKDLLDGNHTELAALKAANDNLRTELKAANDNRDAEMKALRLENAALRKDLIDLRKAFEAFKPTARPRADNDNHADAGTLRAGNDNHPVEIFENAVGDTTPVCGLVPAGAEG